MHYYCGLCSQFWLYEVVFPECTCEEKSLDCTTLQSGVEEEREEECWLLSPVLPVDFILHPAAAAAAAPTLSFGALVNIVGDEAALPLWAWHIFIIIALGVLGRKARVCRHVRRRATVQFGNVAKGIRSLYGIWWDCTAHLRIRSAGVGLCLPPGGDPRDPENVGE